MFILCLELIALRALYGNKTRERAEPAQETHTQSSKQNSMQTLDYVLQLAVVTVVLRCFLSKCRTNKRFCSERLRWCSSKQQWKWLVHISV